MRKFFVLLTVFALGTSVSFSQGITKNDEVNSEVNPTSSAQIQNQGINPNAVLPNTSNSKNNKGKISQGLKPATPVAPAPSVGKKPNTNKNLTPNGRVKPNGELMKPNTSNVSPKKK